MVFRRRGISSKTSEGKRIARDLWKMVLDSRIETGSPYMLNKDSVNPKTNQMNVEVVKSSNLWYAVSWVCAGWGYRSTDDDGTLENYLAKVRNLVDQVSFSQNGLEL